MSDLLSIATIVLAGIVQASLQLSLGGLVLLYHSSMGRHKRRKTRYLAKNYIIGACAISFVIVCAGAFVIQHLFGGPMTQEWMMIIVGAFAACSLVMWLGYFRDGKGTELWLPKSFSRFITRRAKYTNDNIEAFSLGMLSAFAEFPITLAIYFVVANCLLNVKLPLLAVLIYIAIVSIPMVALKINIKTGKNIIAAQKWRIRNKRFAKFFSGSGFAVLAIFLIAFWVI
ncbi:hypothetical protein IJV57_03490 [Candidatus Saccharibacteria bacterium]|nr:hypothetical protein [Candidatus Saccharibacteria bacterium]